MRKILLLNLFLLLLGNKVLSQTFQVDTIILNGHIENRINIVFLGDGYLASEFDKYIIDVKSCTDNIFSKPPYAEYANYFNVFAVKVPSNESGAAMDPDNLIDNYFGSTFWYAGIERLLVPTNDDKIFDALINNFPSYDQVIMLVNSTKYGGSGGWVATTSIHESFHDIILHEMGHSFGNLADEYWAGSQYASEKANMTQQSDPDLVKWSEWLYTNNIGIYEYEFPGEGWYRPHQYCQMRYLGNNFCSVCTEATIKEIYNFIEPYDNYYPANSDTVLINDSLLFQADIIKTIPNTLVSNWYLNDILIHRNTDSMILKISDVGYGDSKLVLEIVDTTSLVRSDDENNYVITSIKWDILSKTTSIESLYENPDLGLELFPNPVENTLFIRYKVEELENISIVISDDTGKIIEIINIPGQHPGTYSRRVSMDKYKPGMYIVWLYIGNIYQTKKIIKI